MDPRNGTLVAQVYEKRNVPALAIAACEEVLHNPSVTPTASFVHFTGTLYQKAERYNEARDKYLQAMQIDSTYAPVLKDLAGLFAMAKQYDKSSKVYLKYLEQEPNDLDAMVGLVNSLSEAGRASQALSSANKAMQIDSTRADVRIAYARAAIKSRDQATQSRAAAVYASLPDSLVLSPKDHTLLAGYQIETKKLDEARRNLGAAIAGDSTYADAYYQLGLLAFKTNNPDSAAGYFSHAIRLDPKVPLYHLNLGVAQFQTKRMDLCIPTFSRCARTRPEDGHRSHAARSGLPGGRLARRRALRVPHRAHHRPEKRAGVPGSRFLFPESVFVRGGRRGLPVRDRIGPAECRRVGGAGPGVPGAAQLGAAESAFRKAQTIDPNNASLKSGRELLNRARQSAGG